MLIQRHCWYLCHCVVKPKFHYTDFYRNFPAGKVVDTSHESRGHKRWQIMKPWSFGESRRHKSRKSRTQTISTCLRQSPWQVHDKPVCVALMEFSPLQCTRKVGDKVRDQVREKFQTKSRTQIMKVRDTNHVAYFRDLSPRLCWELVPDFVAKSA